MLRTDSIRNLIISRFLINITRKRPEYETYFTLLHYALLYLFRLFNHRQQL